MPLGEDSTFAGYTIVRPLGAGGMGEVYLAKHPRLPRNDALKLLGNNVSADPNFRERFLPKLTWRASCGIPSSSACTTVANSRATCGSRWTSSTATTRAA